MRFLSILSFLLLLLSCSSRTSEGNKENGDYKEYYGNGNLRLEQHYVNGELNGESRHYFEEGSTYLIANYKNGKLHGKRTEYYTFGAIQSICQYNNGERIDCEIWRPKNENELTDLEIELLKKEDE